MNQDTSAIPANMRLPNFFPLLKESLQIYKAKWKTLLGLSLASYGIALISAAVSAIIGSIALSFAAEILFLILAIIMMLAIAVLTALLGCWLQASAIIVLKDRGEMFGIRQAMHRGKPFALPYFWITLLLIPMLFLGYIFFLVPGIIFSVWFSFARYVVLDGKEKGISALAKSREWTRGFFWSVLLLMLLGMFSIFFADAVFSSFKQLPSGNLLYTAASILLAPLPTIYYYLIFDHLKKIKGSAAASATAKQKNIFTSLIALGTILIICLAGLLSYFAPEIKNFYEIELPKYQSQNGNRLPPLPQNPI